MTAYADLSTSILYEWTGRILLFGSLHACMSAFSERPWEQFKHTCSPPLDVSKKLR